MKKKTRYLHENIDWPTLSKFITFTEEHTHIKSNVQVCAISSITYAIGPTQTKWTSSVFFTWQMCCSPFIVLDHLFFG